MTTRIEVKNEVQTVVTVDTDNTKAWRIFPPMSTDEFSAIEVRKETCFGEMRVTVGHSSKRYQSPAQIRNMAIALEAAAKLAERCQAEIDAA